VFSESALPQTRRNLIMLALDNPQDRRALVDTQFTEQNGALSPNEQWLAYESNDTGEFEIYVRPFPAVKSGQWKVSTNGGLQPVWRRDGKELFYRDKFGALMSVARAPTGAPAFRRRFWNRDTFAQPMLRPQPMTFHWTANGF
jgi:hypothetical protein